VDRIRDPRDPISLIVVAVCAACLGYQIHYHVEGSSLSADGVETLRRREAALKLFSNVATS